MLEKGEKTNPIRYYIINRRCLNGVIRTGKRSQVVLSRPTRWQVFLRGFLHLDDDLAFVRLPDSLVRDFLVGDIIGRQLDDGSFKINNHIPITIEPWTFFTMCKFCFEGIKFGTFQRFWRWIW